MGKKKATTKKKRRGRPKKEKPVPVPEQAVPSQPVPVPPAPVGQASVAAVVTVLPEPVATPQPLGLNTVRQWFRVRSQTLMQESRELASKSLIPNLELPTVLVTELDNVLCCLEQWMTRQLVGGYTKLVEVTLFWLTNVKEQRAKVEAALEQLEAMLDTPTRAAIVAAGGKVTEAAVKSAKAADTECRVVSNLAAEWKTFEFQIQNILNSLDTDIIVQASVWTQGESGYKDPGFAGAPSGPAFQG